ncbi:MULTISPECIES: hypothetical protein [unclassified Streptomyces]|uniref:hypothetical protein n=1 Tax=unclassified Streptomyces TaxID=2593676 RepID=UPI0033205D20
MLILQEWIETSGLTGQKVHARLVPEHYGMAEDAKVPGRSRFYEQLQGHKVEEATIKAIEDICFGCTVAERLQPALQLLHAAQSNPTTRSVESARLISDLESQLAARNEELIITQGRQIELLEETQSLLKERQSLKDAFTRSDALIYDTQQLVAGLYWASSELERELVQCKRERAALRVVVGPDAAELAEARARIQELEHAQKELASQLAQAKRERDAALELNEELMAELHRVEPDEETPGFAVDFAAEGLWASDPLGQDRGPTDVHTVLNRTRKMMYDLREKHSELRRSVADFSMEKTVPTRSDQPARQATEVELYAKAMRTEVPGDIAHWIDALRSDGHTENVISQRLINLAQRGSESVGGFARYMDLVDGVSQESHTAATQLLMAAGAYREIGELRTHLRRHAESPIGSCFLRGMALGRPPADLAHALRFLRKGSMSNQEDRALAERVLQLLAEFGTEERLQNVLRHLTKTDGNRVQELRKRRNSATSAVRPTNLPPVGSSPGRIITGMVVSHGEPAPER